MTDHNYCVILAGGIGTRFWPVSREYKPKQFHTFWGKGHSFLQETWERMSKIVPESNILVATLSEYASIVKEQLPHLLEDNLILEPYGRNTAPTIAYASNILRYRDPEAIMLATPADHAIKDEVLFCNTVRKGMEYAASGNMLLTLGIVPTRPDTNFGYVQVSGGSKAALAEFPVKAKTFTEKPDAELAKVFIDSGEFLWNSGIFIWKVSTVLEEMEACCPQISRLWEGWPGPESPDEEAFAQKAYADSLRISIDYALMEKSEKVWVLPSKFDWSDLGSWSTLYEYADARDPQGNVLSMKGPHILKDVRRDILFNLNPGKLTVVSGIEDYMVIDTDKVLLVCPRDDKRFAGLLSELALPEYSEFK